MTYGKKQKDLNKNAIQRKSAKRHLKSRKQHTNKAYRKACSDQLNKIEDIEYTNGMVDAIKKGSLPKIKHSTKKNNLKRGKFAQLVNRYQTLTPTAVEESLKELGFKGIEAHILANAIVQNNVNAVTSKQLNKIIEKLEISYG